MKIEKLGKNHRKEVIGGLIVISVIGILAVNLTKAKYQGIEDIKLVEGNINYKPYDFKMMAMYKSDDGTNYTEIDKTPRSNYKINEEKSYCTLNNVDKDNSAMIYTDRFGHHVFNNLSKNSKCYVWFDKNTEVVNTVLGSIEVNNYTPDFSETATTDEGIFKAEDNDGVSYYWRGAATTNYLKFGGYCWRIIRINGDGTIRLIYDGTTCHNNGEVTTDSIAIENVAYNPKYNRSEYVGWTYTEGKQRPEIGDVAIDSNAKLQLEDWYDDNLINYNAKIADGKFCNDRNVSATLLRGYDYISSWSTSGASFAYSGLSRLYDASYPTLRCTYEDVYEMEIGLITMDEVMYAGSRNINNVLYYLYNGQSYWTMSPAAWFGGSRWIGVFYVHNDGKIYEDVFALPRGLRPVINLKADTQISSGNGTLNNPYVVI